MCEEVTRTLNREKCLVEEDLRKLKTRYDMIKQKLSEKIEL